MSRTAAIYYVHDGYSTSGKRLLGRQSAGESFLRGLVQFGTAPELHCYTSSERELKAFTDQARAWTETGAGARPVHWAKPRDEDALRRAGTLYRPDPGIGELAWRRRFGDQRAYSLCGVTHTIASSGTLEKIGALLLAPVQPWDAVICTSDAVKVAVDRLLEDWGEYLEERVGARPCANVQLPVIPLGIDCDAFAPDDTSAEHRKRWRERLGAADEDVVVLFLGRLIFYAKAHPVPMHLALEEAARASDRTVHLVQAGWFESEREEAEFREAAIAFSPSVKVHFPDGRDDDVRRNIWRAADIFCSLSDNIQETFGLTPIEAMAAGLPVVISHWNGYKESVEDGVQGFCVPTTIPSSGSGEDLAQGYGGEDITYSAYVGHAAMATAVDLRACVEAFRALISDPDLRRQQGEAGVQRARRYDWSSIIPAYEALWADLAQRRNHAAMVAPRRESSPHRPLLDDPFRFFSHYSTRVVGERSVYRIAEGAGIRDPEDLAKHRLTEFGSNRRLPLAQQKAILARITAAGALSMTELQSHFPEVAAPLLYRTIVYLSKFGAIEEVI